jgi:uncharacterized membrane protein
VFDQMNGLPVHVLVVHAAVVFVPLLGLGAIVYALVRRWRSQIGWAVVLLAVVAPLASLAAKLSGEKLYDRLQEQGISGRGAEIIDDHSALGNLTFYFAVALGIVSLIMVFATMRARALPRIADLGLAVVMVVLAAISGYYVFQTGDSGATAVWGTY